MHCCFTPLSLSRTLFSRVRLFPAHSFSHVRVRALFFTSIVYGILQQFKRIYRMVNYALSSSTIHVFMAKTFWVTWNYCNMISFYTNLIMPITSKWESSNANLVGSIILHCDVMSWCARVRVYISKMAWFWSNSIRVNQKLIFDFRSVCVCARGRLKQMDVFALRLL